MAKIFDQLDDEAEKTAGQEVGEAIATALLASAKSNEVTTAELVKCMQDSMEKLSERNQVEKPNKVLKWKFSIEYKLIDGFQRPSIVTATAA
jgi:hypothetical protein